MAALVRDTVHERVALRERAKKISLEVEGPEELDTEEAELLQEEGVE